MSEEKKASLTKNELLMMAHMIGAVHHELQWLIEFVRTKTEEMGFEIEE